MCKPGTSARQLAREGRAWRGGREPQSDLICARCELGQERLRVNVGPVLGVEERKLQKSAGSDRPGLTARTACGAVPRWSPSSSTTPAARVCMRAVLRARVRACGCRQGPCSRLRAGPLPAPALLPPLSSLRLAHPFPIPRRPWPESRPFFFQCGHCTVHTPCRHCPHWKWTRI